MAPTPQASPPKDLPPNYLERVYAGVLGKLLGHIHYYVHDRFNKPLVAVDDDISGTFQFIRALEEHGISDEITSEDIGPIETGPSSGWEDGNGVPAPFSGSCQTNSKRIFIDGWGVVSPGNPLRAARLARAAGSVSHGGESVYAAQLWAAMEAEAFVSRDIDHFLHTGLSDEDWLKTRERIEASYGYDKFVVLAMLSPIMPMLIMNTCGWDTDCNSGNVGCLVAIMLGLTCFEGKYDWRGPLADRALLSTAEVGYSINNAARIAIDIANMGRLATHLQSSDARSSPIEVSTPIFGSLEEATMSLCPLSASPLLYPDDSTKMIDGPSIRAHSGGLQSFDLTNGRPLQRVGICIRSNGDSPLNGTIWLDSLQLHPDMSSLSFVLSQSYGEGIAMYGAKDWIDSRIFVPKVKVNMGAPVGVGNRYYALLLVKGRRVALVKAKDEQRITLASAAFDWSLDCIRGRVNGVRVTASDGQQLEGGIGLVVTEGAICVDSIEISHL
ncbi:ADP-ribosylation/Crystallin J1 [Aspergillus navahoensis]